MPYACCMCGPEQLNWCSDSLWARWSGERIPVGARFSASIQNSPGVHPASYTLGTRSFLAVKLPGRGINYPPPSSTEVKEWVKLYLYSPFRPLWLLLGWTLLLPLPLCMLLVIVDVGFAADSTIDPLKMKRIYPVQGLSVYHAVNTLHLGGEC